MKKLILILIIAIIILLPFLWYTISPFFIDEIVNEKIPISNSNLDSVNEDLEKNNPVESEKRSISLFYQGNFVDADSFHKASGIAKIISNSDKKYLRFEEFEVTNGPNLYVYLSVDSKANDFIDLGKLKGNIGDQNYEISSEKNLEKYSNVLIWCKRFGVLFGSAKLEKTN